MLPDTAQARSGSPALWLGLTGLVIAALVGPVLAVRFLPLNDYPFHLARIIIMHGLDQPLFDRFYDLGHWLLPNVALDAVGLALAQLVGPEAGVRLFIVLTLLLLIGGALVLHRAGHGRSAIWPLLAFVPIYNGILSYGFLNYLFGTGLALVFAAAWISWRQKVWTLPAAFCASVLLMLCHMEAFGIFAVLVGASELAAAWQRLSEDRWSGAAIGQTIRRLVLAACPLIAVLALFLLLSPTREDIGTGLRYDGYWLGHFVFGPALAIASPLPMLDILAGALAAAIACWAALKGRLGVSLPLALGAALLGLAVLVLPRYLLGSDFANTRLAPIAIMVGIAALDIRAPATAGRRTGRDSLALALVAVVVVLALGRGVGFGWLWRGWEQQIAPVAADFEALPEGAVVFAAVHGPYTMLMPNSAEASAAWKPSMKHVTSYAALDRPRFVPMNYADPLKQPLQVAPAYADIKAMQGHNPFRVATPTELVDLVGRIGELPMPNGEERYLSLVGSAGPFDWEIPPGTTEIARGPRHLLLRLDTGTPGQGR